MARFERSKSLKAQAGTRPRSRREGTRFSRTRFLPSLDRMEDRILLSMLTVTNTDNSGSGSLLALIAAARSGDTIDFANSLKGQTITLTTGELEITTNLIIDGPAHGQVTVSGGGTSRVFDIGDNANVTINDLTVTDGHTVGDSGGGILVESGATLTLDRVVLDCNQALADNAGALGGSGGGVESAGTLTVTDSTFTDNVASLSSIVVGSQGGAIDSSGPSLTVINSAFTSNKADGTPTGAGAGDGGAINSNGSTVTITNSTFSGNEALGRTVNGGAISVEGPLAAASNDGNTTITDSLFTGNQAIGGNGANDFTFEFGGQALGGAVFTDSALTTIADSVFTDNLAKGGDQGNNSSGVTDQDTNGFVGLATGGGVCNQGASLNVTNSLFTGNVAKGGNSGTGVGGSAAGGGILSAGFSTATLTRVTLLGNGAFGGNGAPASPGGSGVGGGFYNGFDATATVSRSLFLANQAVGGAGGSKATGGVGEGGAIANGGGFGDLLLSAYDLGPDDSSLALDQSTLALNVALGGNGGAGGNGGNGLGGAVFADAGTIVVISASSLSLNMAIGGAGTDGGVGYGGGIYVTNGASVSLEETAVRANDASTSFDNIDGAVTYLS
jgi:hypothetical protein